MWLYSPESAWKIIFFLGSVSESFVGRKLLGKVGSCCGIVVFRWCFAYGFVCLCVFVVPENACKTCLLLRFGFWNSFLGANFCFCCRIVLKCFLVVFCLRFLWLVWFHSPESAWKTLFFFSSVFGNHFLEGNSWFRCVVGPFVCSVVLPIFCLLVRVLVPKMLGKNYLLLRLGFWNPFWERIFVFAVLLCSSVFGGVLLTFFFFLSLSRSLSCGFRKRLENYLLLRFGFWKPFLGGNSWFWCVVAAFVFFCFGGVLPMLLLTCVFFCSRKCLAKMIFFWNPFWARVFVFAVLLRSSGFWLCFACIFAYWGGVYSPESAWKICFKP